MEGRREGGGKEKCMEREVYKREGKKRVKQRGGEGRIGMFKRRTR